MGSDEYFKRRKSERAKRKENIKKQKSNIWLVVCEGKETEPNYFKGAIDVVNKNLPNEYKLKVKFVGEGKNTISLVKSVEDIQNEIDDYKISKIFYGKIFVVFDRDSFSAKAFDEAITMCNNNGYIPLWSNQAIEYWFLLHFNYIDGGMDRKMYAQKLNEYFKDKGLDYSYTKNDKDIYLKLSEYGSLNDARKNASRIHLGHLRDKPSDAESCTTVYQFFDEIDERLKELD